MTIRRGLFATAILAIAVAGCGPSMGKSSDPPDASSSSSPPPITATADAGAFVLRRAPDDLGCDAIGLDYRSVTFHIDPAAAEHVSAVTDQGKPLLTFWSDGFVPGTAEERVIRDPSGAVVVSDGEVLAIPAAAWPRLHGYFVCAGPDALYVLLADPT